MAETDVVERELDLRSEMPFLQSEAHVHALLAIARNVEFKPDEHIFERGGPIDRVYLLTHGEVEIALEGSPSWRIVDSGGIGFIDFMMGRPHARTAIARGRVRALEIDAADYRDYMQDHSDVGLHVLTGLSGDMFDDLRAARPGAALLHRPADVGRLDVPTDPTLVDRLVLLSRVPAFARATVQSLANLAQQARIVRYGQGDMIAPAGVSAEVLSVLVEGQVELVDPTSGDAVLRGPVDLVCHIAELSTAPRRMSARAARDSLVLQIDREELLDRIDEHFELAQSLFAYIAGTWELINNADAEARRSA